MEFRIIKHGTPEYEEMVRLRSSVLREPIGLRFKPEELAAETDYIHIGCYKNGELAASVIHAPQPGPAVKMRQFAVRADSQREGIGGALLREAERVAKAMGYSEIFFNARSSAIGFYLKHGYKTEGEEFEEVTLPHVRMRKRLIYHV